MAKWFNHRIWKQYLEDIKVDYKSDMDKFLRHVVDVANTFPRHGSAIGPLDINDLISSGNEGLVRGWKKIDWNRIEESPNPDGELWSFLKIRIKHTIRREIDNVSNMIKIPRRDLEEARKKLKHHEKTLVNIFPKFFDEEVMVPPPTIAYRSVLLEEFLFETLKKEVDNVRDIDIFFMLNGIGFDKMLAREVAEKFSMSEINVKKIKAKILKIMKQEDFAKKVQNFLYDSDYSGNITYEGISRIIDALNKTNEADYSSKTDGNFRRQVDKDITYNRIENTNWEAESAYHNYYFKPKTTRQIKVAGFNPTKPVEVFHKEIWTNIGNTQYPGLARCITPEEADKWYKEEQDAKGI